MVKQVLPSSESPVNVTAVEKSALIGSPNYEANLADRRAEILRTSLADILQKIFLGSAAIGAGARGLYGTARTITRNLSSPPSALSQTFPVIAPSDDEKQAAINPYLGSAPSQNGRYLTLRNQGDRLNQFLTEQPVAMVPPDQSGLPYPSPAPAPVPAFKPAPALDDPIVAAQRRAAQRRGVLDPTAQPAVPVPVPAPVPSPVPAPLRAAEMRPRPTVGFSGLRSMPTPMPLKFQPRKPSSFLNFSKAGSLPFESAEKSGTSLTLPFEWLRDKFGGSLSDLFSGRSSTDFGNYPYTTAGVALAAPAGLYGGWKLTDWVIDKARKKQMQQELEEAKREYEQALLPSGSKQASALGQSLDALYAACCSTDGLLKQAETRATSNPVASWLPGKDWLGPLVLGGAAASNPGLATNVFLGSAIPIAALSALATYSVMRKSQNKKKLLAEAARQRAQRMLSGGPAFAYVDDGKSAGCGSVTKSKKGRKKRASVQTRYVSDSRSNGEAETPEFRFRAPPEPSGIFDYALPRMLLGAAGGGVGGGLLGSHFGGAVGNSAASGAVIGSLLGLLADRRVKPSGRYRSQRELHRTADLVRNQMPSPLGTGVRTGLLAGLPLAYLGAQMTKNGPGAALGLAGIPVGLAAGVLQHLENKDLADVLSVWGPLSDIGAETLKRTYNEAKTATAALTGLTAKPKTPALPAAPATVKTFKPGTSGVLPKPLFT